jgi:hypothetical protein
MISKGIIYPKAIQVIQSYIAVVLFNEEADHYHFPSNISRIL